MRVVVAPDSMGGLVTAPRLAAVIAEAWRTARPGDEVVEVPMSDGGEGLLEVVHRPEDTRLDVEVVGPLGHPVDAWVSLRPDGTAIVESALACGLGRLSPGQRDPRRATTWGVGQLLDAAREAGARRVLVGLGGSATVDGGAGALSGLGFRVRVADGSGLKVGAADLHRAASIERGWVHPGWDDTPVELLADVRTPLAEAPARFGPQKGATPDVTAELEVALERWAQVVGEAFGMPDLAAQPGTGAAGGLGYGLAAALGARLVPGLDRVAELVGLDAQLANADVVVTGEGRLDPTSFDGKVVGEVIARARSRGRLAGVVAGRDDRGRGQDGDGVVVELAPAEDADVAEAAVRAACTRLADRLAAPPTG